jgi:hypothetical protein
MGMNLLSAVCRATGHKKNTCSIVRLAEVSAGMMFCDAVDGEVGSV